MSQPAPITMLTPPPLQGEDLTTAFAWGLYGELEDYVERGGDLSVTNEFGNTILHLSIIHARSRPEMLGQRTELFYLLIDKGADINAHGSNGMTPLMLAMRIKEEAMAEYLLMKGADIFMEGKKGDTAATYAAGNAEFERLLVMSQEDIRLHRAFRSAAMDDLEDLRHLIEVDGISPFLKDKEGRSLLDAAAPQAHAWLKPCYVERDVRDMSTGIVTPIKATARSVFRAKR